MLLQLADSEAQAQFHLLSVPPLGVAALAGRKASVNRSSSSLVATDVDVEDEPAAGDQLENQLFEGYSDELLTFAWIACIVFIIVGVPGNLLTIIALSRGKQTRNSTAIFIINLSCSDLLFGCFNLPLATSTFKERAWTHSDLMCRLFPLLRYGLMAVSLLSVSLITINRYIIIAHPRQYPRIYQRRYLALMVASTWLITFSIMIPTWRGIWGRFGLDTSIGSCSILHDKNDRSPKEFLFMIAFLLPCICIVICYARIFLLVRQAAIRAGANAAKNSEFAQTPPITAQKPPDNVKDKDKEKDKAKSKSKGKDKSKSKDKNKDKEKSNKEANSSSEDTSLRPFVVNESLAYIDDNVSTDNFPISYSIQKEPPIDANVVLQQQDNRSKDTSNVTSAAPSAATVTDTPLNDTNAISRSQTLVEQSKNSKNPITTSLRTSFTRFNPRKSHYVSMGNTSNASSIYPGRMSAKDRRLLKMILVIFVWFVICYLPITVSKIWKSANNVHVFNIMGYLLIYLTTCINPFIYVLMSSEYRRAYWNLLRCHQTEQKQQHQRAMKKHLESNRAAKT
ncbi:G-protein coupled receptor moody [Drosophila albomicans]|uniref:G-protein coupled receptor moody n=1 Tax=Drosophila albomicans TaxID=7291 RepID=A0A6P8WY64_DROAB|nr:G-protein coupled receptor moody [Drosophila albomicans]